MSVRYEIVELPNGDVALQREQSKNDIEAGYAPLVTMRFSMELLRCFQSKKIDIAKVMVEAGLERIAQLAEEYSKEIATERNASTPAEKQNKANKEASKQSDTEDDEATEAGVVSHMVH